jgi:uncharacterized oxidoreductase
MHMTQSTILITGGSSGIGLALAERLLAAGNTVIICGRRADALAAVKAKHPAIHTVVADTGNAADRQVLFDKIAKLYPDTNVVINNAGIQRRVDLTKNEPWADTETEIAINFDGPVHLSSLFVPFLLQKKTAVLANVSSGLAFVPIAAMPIYCATKAALHSFTLSLRHQLKGTSVEVVEIIPPAVRTNLGGAHDFGAPLDEYADSAIAQLTEGRPEVTYQFSAQSSQASRAGLEELFKVLNSNA